MDEFIDSLLVEELVCDIALPHLPKRIKLEQLGILDERTSILDADLLNAEEDAVIVAYNLKIASQTKKVNDDKLSEPDATVIVKHDDKIKYLNEPSPGNEEYISEYRRDDARSRKAAAIDNDDDSRKDIDERGEKRRGHSADRGRSRRDSSREKYGPGINRARGDQRDNGRNRDNKYIPLRRSESRDKAHRRERERTSKHDDSRSRSRTRDRKRDRDDRGSDRYESHRGSDSRKRDSDHNRRGRDRARSHSYDSRSRSRSPISKHSKQSRKSSSKGNDYYRRERRGDRERSESRSRPSSRRSGRSRYKSASIDSEKRSRKSRRQSRSPSLSRSRSPSHSSSSSESESDRENRTKKTSTALNVNAEDITESAEDSAQALVSLAEEKAAALKASKAEKKFDKMFKTKKSNTGRDSQGSSDVAVKAHPEGSVEYWNQIREGLGIKKLKS